MIPRQDALPARSLPHTPENDPVWPQVQGYQILDKLGEGGMGSVWRAVQLSTKREVALKVLSARAFGSARARSRFEREVELTARLEHRHIARVYDSGMHQGVCFYAMELIAGLPLDEFVRDNRLDPRQVLQLMRDVCLAVQHAHLHGIIHRDLKPANILIDAHGNPHVLDFGLAKALLLEDLAVSVEGEVAGTPEYMSPEQASCSGRVDARTDVYSLGVILYRLLTGRAPHDLTGTPLQVLRRIVDEAPLPPRLDKKRGGRELESVLLKALSPDVNKRYSSAGELARDIERFLNSEPVEARSPSLSYIVLTRLRRHWIPTAGVVVALVVILSVVIYSLARITAERNTAVTERNRANDQTRIAGHNAQVAVSAAANAERERVLAQRSLARSLKAQGDALAETGQWVDAKRLYLQSRQIFLALKESPIEADLGLVQAHAVAPPPLNRFVGHTDFISCAAFSPDSRIAVTGSFDHTLKLWDVRTGRELRTLAGHLREVNCVAFSPDGKQILSGGKDDTARLWDVASGRELFQLPHTYEVFSVAFSSDGSLCATSTWDGFAKVWETGSGKLIVHHSSGASSIDAICFEQTPAGGRPGRIFFGQNRVISEVKLANGERTQVGKITPEATLCLTTAPNGKLLLVGQNRQRPQDDETLLLVSTQSGEVVRRMAGHGGALRSVSFLPDSVHALSAADDGLIKRWNIDKGEVERTFYADDSPFESVAFSPDGKLAISGGHDNVGKLWDLTDDPTLAFGRSATITAMASSSDGNLLLWGNVCGGIRLWDVAGRTEIAGLKDNSKLTPWSRIQALALSPDGRKAYAASADGKIAIYDLTTKREEDSLCQHPNVRSLALSPDGRRAMVADGGNVAVWDLATRQRIFALKTPSTLVARTGYAEAGSMIVGSSSHGEAFYWDAISGDCRSAFQLFPVRRELDNEASVAYTDNLTTMLGIAGTTIRVWSPKTNVDIARLNGHTANVQFLQISPDQKWAASASLDATVRLWDLAQLRQLQCFRGHGLGAESLAFSPDGTRLFAAGTDTGIRVWDFARPQQFIDFASRLEQARQALVQDPENAAALATLGEWYAFRGRDEWAVELLEHATQCGAKVSPLLLARLYWRLEKIDQARAAFEKAIQCHEATETYLRQCIGALQP